MEIQPAASRHDLQTIERLAHTIWNEHYVPLIGQGQVDYMLDKFQTVAAFEDQIEQGYEYFLIRLRAEPVGYFAIQPEPAARSLFLSKLYIDKTMRGQGLGAAAVEYIESLCKARGLNRVRLNVNKGNSAVQAYQRLGFRIVEAVVVDIGGGYAMDDFRMEKTL